MKVKRDVNGNPVLALEKSDLAGARGFSIQTFRNLPRTYREGVGPWSEGEARAYIAKNGTARQKRLLGVH